MLDEYFLGLRLLENPGTARLIANAGVAKLLKRAWGITIGEFMPYLFVVLCIGAALGYRRVLSRGKSMVWPFASQVRKLRAVIFEIIDILPTESLLVVLSALFIFQLLLIQRMDIAIDPASIIAPDQPVLFAGYFNFLHGLHSSWRHAFDAQFVACVSLETATLFALHRHITLRAFRLRMKIGVAGTSLVLFIFALLSRAQVSADFYGYISYAHYGFVAYSPPPLPPFTGNFSMLNPIDVQSWKVLPPCPYGPIWLAVNHVLTAPAQTVWQAILIERASGMIAVLVCAWAIFRIRGSLALACIFLLNPMVIFNYVVEAHNDIWGLMCVLLAAVSFQRPMAAILWQAAAGLIKLPYIILAALSYTKQKSLATRIGASVGALMIMAIVSIILGGRAYIGAIFFHIHENGQQHNLVPAISHFILIALFVYAMFVAVIQRRFYREMVPAFIAPAATLYPWYLGMAVPYIIIGDVAPITWLATLPMSGLFADVLLGTKFAIGLLLLVVALGSYLKVAGKPEPLKVERTIISVIKSA